MNQQPRLPPYHTPHIQTHTTGCISSFPPPLFSFSMWETTSRTGETLKSVYTKPDSTQSSVPEHYQCREQPRFDVHRKRASKAKLVKQSVKIPVDMILTTKTISEPRLDFDHIIQLFDFDSYSRWQGGMASHFRVFTPGLKAGSKRMQQSESSQKVKSSLQRL